MASSLGRVAVIAGGLSHEREVSLRSGRRLLNELRDIGVDAALYDADSALLSRMRRDDVDVAFPMVHGEMGEDGVLQTVLELAGLPFVGTASKACRVAWDKTTARVLTERQGLPVPEWRALTRSAFRDLGAHELVDSLVRELVPPIVVKPSRGGSVLGVSGVAAAADLPPALVRCFSYGETALIERFVEGVDVSVGVIDVNGVAQALPPVVLRYDREHRFHFAARYAADLVQIEAPALLDSVVAAELQKAAVTCHEVLGLRDLSRSDFLVDADQRFVLLETAITPGLTETSLFPVALTVAGTGLGETAVRLLRAALDR